jgi:hypothetical protein
MNKNILKMLALCGLFIVSSTQLFCMEQQQQPINPIRPAGYNHQLDEKSHELVVDPVRYLTSKEISFAYICKSLSSKKKLFILGFIVCSTLIYVEDANIGKSLLYGALGGALCLSLEAIACLCELAIYFSRKSRKPFLLLNDGHKKRIVAMPCIKE